MTGFWDDAEVICAYTRKQAIEDGVLIDITETAKEAGFKLNTVVTSAVYADCVAWDNGTELAYQDESGRLWDILTMAMFGVRKALDAHRVPFQVARIPSCGTKPELVDLVIVCGPGDNAEPVLTIMLPNED